MGISTLVRSGIAVAIVVGQLAGAAAAQSITDVTPSDGTAGTVVTITGQGFGLKPSVKFKNSETGKLGASFTVTNSSDTVIVGVIKKGKPGACDVVIKTKGSASADPSSPGAFTVNAPGLDTLTPTTVQPGETIVLAGHDFGAVAGKLRIGSKSATVIAWADDEIQCQVPLKLKGGFHHFSLKNGVGKTELDGVVFVDPTGLLVGATDAEPAPDAYELLSYDDGDGEILVPVIAQRALVFFDAAVEEGDAVAMIEDHGGAVLGGAPLLGQYVVGTAVDAEAAFLESIQGEPGLNLASPEIIVSGAGSTSTVAIIDSCKDTNPKIGCSGTTHGQTVLDSYEAAAKEFGVSKPKSTTCIGVAPGEDIQDALIVKGIREAILAGNGAPVFVNVSIAAQVRCPLGEEKMIDLMAPDCPLGVVLFGDKWFINWLGDALALKASVAAAMKAHLKMLLAAVASLPEELTQNVAVTVAAGNNNLPIGLVMAELSGSPKLAKVMAEHFLIVGATDDVLHLSNDGAGHADFVNYPSASSSTGCEGTSFAAPQALAVVKYLVGKQKLTVKQAVKAAKAAAANNGGVLTKEKAIEEAKKIKLGAKIFDGDYSGTVLLHHHGQNKDGTNGWSSVGDQPQFISLKIKNGKTISFLKDCGHGGSVDGTGSLSIVSECPQFFVLEGDSEVTFAGSFSAQGGVVVGSGTVSGKSETTLEEEFLEGEWELTKD